MCRVLGASRSGFYSWLKRTASKRTQANHGLLQEIREEFQKSRRTYGSPRIHKVLTRRGVLCSENRIARLMRAEGMKAKAARRFRSTTRVTQGGVYAPDRLQRKFTASRPHEVWTSDITYIWTGEGWLYLAVVLDLFSRAIVGWATSSTINAELVVDAVSRAFHQASPSLQLLFHSDRGSQYVSAAMHKLMDLHKGQITISHAWSCYDNAVTESFFHTLKGEETEDHRFNTRAEAHAVLFDYIEIFYNRQRLHSSINYRTPFEVLAEAEAA
jgi:putative transposase